jgi:hypothetical protein
MSWSFSQVLVGEFLGANSLDTVPSAPLNMTHTPDQFYWPDKPTEHSRLSRFGMTSEPLTADRGAELLTLFLEDSRAKTYPSQAVEMGWTENVADSGGKWRESLARYDPDTHSLKTAQLSLIEDWTGCSVTLPRSGLMLDGQCWELPMLGRITREIESGFLPTPVATDAGSGRFNTSVGGKPRPTLALMARKDLLPTPTVCGNRNRKGASKTSGDGLATAVAMSLTRTSSDFMDAPIVKGILLPTPTAHNAKEKGSPSQMTRNTVQLGDLAAGRLNPQWVEWLMGWPIGHTDLKPLGTDKCPNAVQQPGECLEVSE